MNSSIKKSFASDNIPRLEVYEPEKALQFLTEYLGFYQTPSAVLSPTTGGHFIENDNGNRFFLKTGMDARQNCPSPQKVVIYTGNCLKAYYELKRRSFYTSELCYTKDGLALDIIDHWGNRYMLLETRDYQAY
jgi:hypothetical protein